jgi:hypothetical protein
MQQRDKQFSGWQFLAGRPDRNHHPEAGVISFSWRVSWRIFLLVSF